jgi:thioredoxin reductase
VPDHPPVEGGAREDFVLRRIVFAAGPDLECSAVLFNTAQHQRSPLPGMLGCTHTPDGFVATHGRQRTRVPGLFVAGDAGGDVQFAIVAAAEGATAAVAINKELQEEERGKPG